MRPRTIQTAAPSSQRRRVRWVSGMWRRNVARSAWSRSGNGATWPRGDASCHRMDSRTALADRSEEHTSELQSQSNLVCRLLLEKKKTERTRRHYGKKTNNIRQAD